MIRQREGKRANVLFGLQVIVIIIIVVAAAAACLFGCVLPLADSSRERVSQPVCWPRRSAELWLSREHRSVGWARILNRSSEGQLSAESPSDFSQ